MEEKQIAVEIIDKIGGINNVSHLEHCSTRLRFSLYDDEKVDKVSIQNIPGVLGVIQTGQTQVIIGGGVVEVYKEVEKILSETDNHQNHDSNKKQNWKTVLVDFIISIFQPLIPAIAGGGILKSLLMLLDLIGVMDKSTSTYKLLTFIGDAPLYFLPLLVAITTANKLKVNSLVAVSAVGGLLIPGLTDMVDNNTKLFAITIQNINYAYQVFPAILCIITYSFLEKYLTKISPKVIRSFFVPMMSLLIVVPFTLLILGPIGFTFGQGFAAVVMWIFTKFGWIAVALLAMFLPFMVVTGMHKAMIPYVITSLGETGKEVIYNAASLAHNISEAGACFAVALRTKDKGLKATAISAGVSALFGITEPALYGVTILHKRVLYGVMFGSLIGGATLGILGVEAYVAVGPGVASLSMFISETLPYNLLFAVIGLVVSFVASFMAVFIIWKDKSEDESDHVVEKNEINLNAPMDGELISLSKVNDEVFANKMLGDGVGIIPDTGKLYAPYDGSVTMIYNTKHALGLETAEGIEMLFHIGLDTVNLNGKYFEPRVSVEQEVKQGDLLLEFDLENIKESGFDPTTVFVITEPKNITMDIKEEQVVTYKDNIIKIEGTE
uniref:PTS system, beta-glucoside-specific IIB component / PTS system, beta-glucoside-specific IIC component / PTS system, beta-glucoside-specific IIA component n=1 Tax=Staphylococcus xylosus TaxID=1288 RepID=K8DVJ5_STAXY|nr:PTS system, beta-glucoside-specific IIB component / PTS system, beta-glucoside-specific IIC component / PTS system, beta-glucoside-specific IIA component [Staphylococcus xylosus]